MALPRVESSPTGPSIVHPPKTKTAAIIPTEFVYFGRLAEELQCMVWEIAMEEDCIPCFPDNIRSPLRYEQGATISALCKSARRCVERVRRRKSGIEIGPGPDQIRRLFLPIPDRGTLIIPSHGEPRCDFEDGTIAWRRLTNFEIQQAKTLVILDTSHDFLSVSIATYKPFRGDAKRHQIQLGEARDKEYSRKVPRLVSQSEEVPIDLEKLQCVCTNLEDITFVSKRADWSWWLSDEYRVHGPDVVSEPADNCLWHVEAHHQALQREYLQFMDHGETKRPGEEEEGEGCYFKQRWDERYLYGDPKERGLEYYQQMGMSDDAGITWPYAPLQGSRSPLFHRAFDMLAHRKVSSNAAPKVGLRGFSHNSSSCGGMWVGFRLFLGDRPRLQFSPLTWEDVKDDMYTFTFHTHRDTSTCRKEEIKVDTTFPECIIKITVIKPGERPPPSSPLHCWEPVQGDFGTEELNGFDWRPRINIGPTYPRWDLETYNTPGIDRKDVPLSQSQETKLKFLNRVRIRTFFKIVASHLDGYERHPPDISKSAL